MHLFHRRGVVLIAIACSIQVGLPDDSDAAIVGYTDFASFQDAASGSSTVIDFESSSGSVMTVDGVSFSSSGSGLSIRGVDAGGGDVNNVVGTDNVSFSEIETESILIDFGSGHKCRGRFHCLRRFGQ